MSGPEKTGDDKVPAGIWHDCAHCAHKHLTAAYAALSSLPETSSAANEFTVKDTGILVARARVAIVEAAGGYPGNADLAAGCLALAETICGSGSAAKVLRDVRLRLASSGPNEILLAALPDCGRQALAMAHLTEAVRELPDLGLFLAESSIHAVMTVGDGAVSVQDASGLADIVRDAAGWVRKTYELNGGAQ